MLSRPAASFSVSTAADYIVIWLTFAISGHSPDALANASIHSAVADSACTGQTNAELSNHKCMPA
jgi:hypothetical protein